MSPAHLRWVPRTHSSLEEIVETLGIVCPGSKAYSVRDTMPYYRIVPAFRAPRTIEGFDYAAPKDGAVAVGDLVWIPFRKQKIVGVVAEQLERTTVPKHRVKEILGSYANLRVSAQTIALMHAVALRSLSSPASVLHAWIGSPPKRPEEVTGHAKKRPFKGTTGSVLALNHWDAIVEVAVKASGDGCRVLILTPWTEQAKALAELCKGTALTSDMADGARFKAWSGFVRGDIRCLVATRIGAWLSAEADVVIVDEPENDDHKQDELAPRYDARWVAVQSKTPVLAIGLTPRLTSSQHAPDASAPEIPSAYITWVDTHRADWSGVAGLQGRALLPVEQANEAGHAVTIIHPIHGFRARLRCADCGWSAHCTRCGNGLTPGRSALVCQRCNQEEAMPACCPSCNGTDFSKSRPGRDSVVHDLQHHQLSADVFSLGEWHASAMRLEPQSVVVLTDLSLLAGASEDIRRRERLIIAFRRLADTCLARDAHLVVQGDAALLDDARRWLTSDGCRDALVREWEERKAFQLPPTARLVKLIVRGSGKAAEDVLIALRRAVPKDVSVDGPFAVEKLPGSRTPRSVIQATFPAQRPDAAIHKAISPLLTPNILVDLDPIALFE